MFTSLSIRKYLRHLTQFFNTIILVIFMSVALQNFCRLSTYDNVLKPEAKDQGVYVLNQIVWTFLILVDEGYIVWPTRHL